MSRLSKDNAFPETAAACQSSGRFVFTVRNCRLLCAVSQSLASYLFAGEHLHRLAGFRGEEPS